MGMENRVQGAITAALEVYSDRHHMHTDVFAPYANQQNHRPNGYAADLQCLLDGTRFLLLEVKELLDDGRVKSLPSYRYLQHAANVMLEEMGVPIQYAYAAVDSLSYFRTDRRRQWCLETLRQVLLSWPSELFADESSLDSGTPNDVEHSNLLDWLLISPPVTTFDSGVIAAAASMCVADFRNTTVILIACDKHGMMRTLNASVIGHLTTALHQAMKNGGREAALLSSEQQSLVQQARSMYQAFSADYKSIILEASDWVASQGDKSAEVRNSAIEVTARNWAVDRMLPSAQEPDEPPPDRGSTPTF